MFKGIKLLGIVTITLLTTGCCMTDYSKKIRKVADPMLVELDTFYQTHKRHPNTQERDVLLLKAGCEKVVGNICFRGGGEIVIAVSFITPTNAYRMRMDIEKSLCSFGLNSKGKIQLPRCQQHACISWDH